MIASDTSKNETRTAEPGRLGPSRDAAALAHQELKFSIHRKLLDRINLEAVYATPGERVRQEIRPAVARLVNEEKTPLSMGEKDKLIEEVLDEVFGLGPLEPLLRDQAVSDILVTTPRLIYVERGGKLERTNIEFKDDAHLMRIIERVVSGRNRRPPRHANVNGEHRPERNCVRQP